MSMTQAEKLDHYRTYLKIYGFLIMELADSDTEILNLIQGKNLAPLTAALRERVENSPVYG